MYPIFQVPPGASDLPEALGTKFKFWYRNGDVKTLYKEGRPGSGENWSEKVAAEIAACLALPHALYDLAHWQGRRGVVSPTFVPANGRLILGNEIITRLDSNYAPSQHAKRHKARQHTIGVVLAVLGRSRRVIRPPIGFAMPPQLENAAQIFCGYLLLDALIGNQDRHHENWGLIITPDEVGQEKTGFALYLAPSFDHASSLGRNESDEERNRRLTTRDHGSSIERYVQRARSAFFEAHESNRQLSTIEAFQEAIAVHPGAGLYWLDRLEATTRDMYYDILASVPDSEISGPAREFALEMLCLNRQRLLELLGQE
jgi:hypothetical protein